MRVFQFAMLCFLLFTVRADAAEDVPREAYVAASIPDSLLDGSNAVVRYEKLHVTVKSASRASYSVRRVVTVLKSEAKGFGKLVLHYDKMARVDDFDITLYDAAGEEVRSLKKNEVVDYPASDGMSLYDDNRMKYITLYHGVFPYTLDIEYSYSYDGFINWPSWYPQEEHAGVEKSVFQVDVPAGIPLRYKAATDIEPVVTQTGGNTSYVWTATLLPPFDAEPAGPSSADQMQHVTIAPAAFEVDGHKGDLSSWTSFGSWFYTLYKDRQELPDEAAAEVNAIVAGVSDPKEKIRLLYSHLQKKTRYVSVQLGIGGWQPFPATYVAEKGYGDCKALTNYMAAMLQRQGITSYPALIKNGFSGQSVAGDFSANLFNHVILFVPLERDSLWLECTSQSIPFGHIGRNNENRHALVVMPSGGMLVRTPTSSSYDNRQVRKAVVVLSGTGSGTAHIETAYYGVQQDRVRNGLNEATPREKEEWLRENLDVGGFQLRSAEFYMMSQEERAAGVRLDLALPQVASRAGARLILQPNLLEKRSYVPRPLEKRKHPVVHMYPYLDIDSITYRLPEGFRLEALPKPVTIETSFGKYASGVHAGAPGELLYVRRLEFTFTELPAAMYGEYRQFLLDVGKADKAGLALNSKP